MLHTRPQIQKLDENEKITISFGIEAAPPAGRGGVPKPTFKYGLPTKSAMHY